MRVHVAPSSAAYMIVLWCLQTKAIAVTLCHKEDIGLCCQRPKVYVLSSLEICCRALCSAIGVYECGGGLLTWVHDAYSELLVLAASGSLESNDAQTRGGHGSIIERWYVGRGTCGGARMRDEYDSSYTGEDGFGI